MKNIFRASVLILGGAFLSGCSGTEKKGVSVDLDNKTVIETRSKETIDSYISHQRNWEFGDVEQVCDLHFVALGVFFQSPALAADCKPLDWADPKKVEEMRALLEIAPL